VARTTRLAVIAANEFFAIWYPKDLLLYFLLGGFHRRKRGMTDILSLGPDSPQEMSGTENAVACPPFLRTLQTHP
jgi:hypothetical protein